MAGLGANEEAQGAKANKRPLEGESVQQADTDEQAKRARTDGDASGGSVGVAEAGAEGEAGSEVRKEQAEKMLPALPLEKAVETTEKVSGLKVDINTTRIEVCWEVADEEAEDPRPTTLW